MANNTIKISGTAACTIPKESDLLLVSSANTSNTSQFLTKHSTIDDLFSNVNKILITKTTTPANNNPTGLEIKQFWFDSDYMYVVVSNTEVKRVALLSF